MHGYMKTVINFTKIGDRKRFYYWLNQEKYLKVFLEDGTVSADNSAAEQAIRGFCIGKVNCHMIDIINGAKASAVDPFVYAKRANMPPAMRVRGVC